LGGWSFGGVVAFELARELRSRGCDVQRVTMFDAYGPSAYRRASRGAQPSTLEAFVADLGRTLGIGAEVLAAQRDALGEVPEEERFAWIADRLDELSGGSVQIEAGMLARLHDVYRRHTDAYAVYDPEPQDLRVEVFAAVSSEGDDGDRGWSDLVTGNVKRTRVETDHYRLLQPPNVGGLATRLATSVWQTR
jgi:thioesterase domain-containing protein